jgi:hypothetical protein
MTEIENGFFDFVVADMHALAAKDTMIGIETQLPTTEIDKLIRLHFFQSPGL